MVTFWYSWRRSKDHHHRKTQSIFAVLIITYYCIIPISELNIYPYQQATLNRYYIVFDTILMLLSAVCTQCGSKAVKVQKVLINSYPSIKQRVQVVTSRVFGIANQWSERFLQATFDYPLPSSLLMLCRQKGSSTDLLVVWNDICRHFRHLRYHLQPTFSCVYSSKQTALLSSLEDQHLVLAGDSREDSPGHSAEYGIVWKCHVTRLLTSNRCRCMC